MSKFIVTITNYDCTKVYGSYITEAENKNDAISRVKVEVPYSVTDFKFHTIDLSKEN